MNKRIEELAEQCTIIGQPKWQAEGQYAVDSFDKEKFAELIVQSIANIDFRMELGVTSDQCMDLKNLIKNHFKDEQ